MLNVPVSRTSACGRSFPPFFRLDPLDWKRVYCGPTSEFQPWTSATWSVSMVHETNRPLIKRRTFFFAITSDDVRLLCVCHSLPSSLPSCASFLERSCFLGSVSAAMASISSRNTGLLVLVVMAAVVAAQQPSSGDCNALLTTLLPCVGYVQGNDKQPSKTCCTAVSTVAQTNVTCICQLATSGLGGNFTRALEVPAACNLKNVNLSVCGFSLAPAPAPESGNGGPGSPSSSAGGLWSFSTVLVLASSVVITALSA